MRLLLKRRTPSVNFICAIIDSSTALSLNVSLTGCSIHYICLPLIMAVLHFLIFVLSMGQTRRWTGQLRWLPSINVIWIRARPSTSTRFAFNMIRCAKPTPTYKPLVVLHSPMVHLSPCLMPLSRATTTTTPSACLFRALIMKPSLRTSRITSIRCGPRCR